MAKECVVCGRRGNGVRDWAIVMPGGTVTEPITLCAQDSAPLRRLATRGIRERRVVGVRGLDDLVDTED